MSEAILTSNYENTPMQYTVSFHGCKNYNFQMKNCDFFSNCCCEHRSLVHVRTASVSQFQRVPTIYVLEQKYENKVYPGKPQFYYIKEGCKGVFITRTCLHDVRFKQVTIIYVLLQMRKNITFYSNDNFHFTSVKFTVHVCYIHVCVST